METLRNNPRLARDVQQILVTILCVSGIGIVLNTISPPLFWITLSSLIGLYVATVVFGLVIVPIFHKQLVNRQPNRDFDRSDPHNPKPKKSGFHLFTTIQPGQIKTAELNERCARHFMLIPGKRWAREGKYNSKEYWRIVKTKEGEVDSTPVDDVVWFWRWVALILYLWLNIVFVGIYPIQRIREKELQRIKKRKNAQGRDEFYVQTDWTDHLRGEQFTTYAELHEADTASLLPVKGMLAIEAVIENPFAASYGADNWHDQLLNLVTDVFNRFVKARSLKDVLTATKKEKGSELGEDLLAIEVGNITDDTLQYGVDILRVRNLDTSPGDGVGAEEKKRLYAPALAEAEKEATIIKSEGDAKARENTSAAEADAVEKMGKAIHAGGDATRRAQELEAQVRTAAAAKGTVFMNTSTGATASVDPTQAAILAELQNLTAALRQKGTS